MEPFWGGARTFGLVMGGGFTVLTIISFSLWIAIPESGITLRFVVLPVCLMGSVVGWGFASADGICCGCSCCKIPLFKEPTQNRLPYAVGASNNGPAPVVGRPLRIHKAGEGEGRKEKAQSRKQRGERRYDSFSATSSSLGSPRGVSEVEFFAGATVQIHGLQGHQGHLLNGHSATLQYFDEPSQKWRLNLTKGPFHRSRTSYNGHHKNDRSFHMSNGYEVGSCYDLPAQNLTWPKSPSGILHKQDGVPTQPFTVETPRGKFRKSWVHSYTWLAADKHRPNWRDGQAAPWYAYDGESPPPGKSPPSAQPYLFAQSGLHPNDDHDDHGSDQGASRSISAPPSSRGNASHHGPEAPHDFTYAYDGQILNSERHPRTWFAGRMKPKSPKSVKSPPLADSLLISPPSEKPNRISKILAKDLTHSSLGPAHGPGRYKASQLNSTQVRPQVYPDEIVGS